MFFSKKSAGVSYLMVFLGNPGDQYDNTRHNVGFMVADVMANRYNVKINRSKFKSLTATIDIDGHGILLMKPMTYMNLSGEAVIEAANFYKVPPEHIIVVSDEVALHAGKLRIRQSGSAGGHNGLKNIISHLGTDVFPRVRVGVGQKPHPSYDMAKWVLGKFGEENMKVMNQACDTAADSLETIIKAGIEPAMTRYNGA